MKNRFSKLYSTSIILFILLTNLTGQTTDEFVNPYNQYSESGDNVSLFTGSATPNCPLYQLTTKGNLTLSIELNYSSNIELNTRTSNQTWQTSWVGLGWNLSFGRIICFHNGTITDDDDNYQWINPRGVVYSVIRKNGKYYVKDHPWMQVIRSKISEYTCGWTLIDESGTKYKYGDFVLNTSDSSNWNTLCWNSTGFVGCGFSGSPNYFPYQWDLTEIQDCKGNWIHFKYTKMSGDVSYNGWSPINKYYTKESYPKEISSNNGLKVNFILSNRGSIEYCSPNTSNGDNKETNQPKYETKRLKNIIVTNSNLNEQVLERIAFSYDSSAINICNVPYYPEPTFQVLYQKLSWLGVAKTTYLLPTCISP